MSRIFPGLFITILLAVMAPVQAWSQDEPWSGPHGGLMTEQEESLPESGWDNLYVFPYSTDDIQTWDKSYPLSEVIRKLSAPSGYFIVEEEMTTGPFPLPINKFVQPYLDYFSKKARGGYKRWLRRSGMYEDMIMHEIRQRGMPEELFYMCMIESGFRPTVNSSAQAGGLWQFIRSTGKLFNLEMNYWVDERYDPVKSTRASMNYLSVLYGIFGDWHLAAASYNTGEANVLKAMKRKNCSDYWCLVEKKGLHRETQLYVPQIVAAAIIGRHLERYGFDNVERLPPIKYTTVTVNDATDLRVVARCANATLKEIKFLNPELLQFCTPPGKKRYQVKIPPGRTGQFQRAYAALSHDEKQAFRKHTVTAGQTVRKIAAGYQTSSLMLASMNGLSRKSALREGQLLVVPVPKNLTFDPKRKPPTIPPPPGGGGGRRRRYYTLEPGDSLWTISRKVGASVHDLKRWNKIKDPTTLKYGDKIVYYGRRVKQSATVKAPKIHGSTRKISYTVRTGDRCYFIARHYGIHSSNIISKNKLDANCSIRPGQKIALVVPKNAPHTMPPTTKDIGTGIPKPKPYSPGSKKDDIKTTSYTPKKKPTTCSCSAGKRITHTVAPGENLWSIARRYDAYSSEIKACSGLESEALKVGKKLTICPGSEYKSGSVASSKTTVKKVSTASTKTTVSCRCSSSKRITHAVQPGENLWGIATKYDAYSSEIKACTGLESETLKIGQKLKICPGSEYRPGKTVKSSTPKKTTTSSSSSSSSSSTKDKRRTFYTVQDGECLGVIAEAHDVRVADMMKWNGMESDAIRVGQKLVIYK